MFIAGAIIIGAGASLAGGAIAASGARSAARSQQAAADKATQAQLDMFHESNVLSAPGRNLGFGAQGKLASLFGINPGTLTNTTYSNTPNGQNSGGGGGWNGGVPSYGGGGGVSGSHGIGRRVSGMSESGPGGRIESGGFSGVSGAAGTRGYSDQYIPGLTPGTKEDWAAGHASRVAASGGMQVGPDGKPVAGSVPGMGSPSSSGQPDYSGFYDTPGFQFAKDMGNLAVNRNVAAGGGLYSANTLTEQNKFSTGFAAQHYNDYVQQLLSMAGMGNGAAQAGGTNAIATGQGISNNAISSGNAAAAGAIGSSNAYTGAIGGIGNAVSGYYQNREQPYTGTNLNNVNAMNQDTLSHLPAIG
jgi:hypothetical protein